MVSDVTINSVLNQQATTNASTSQLAADFSQFLTLLTIQLQNQDPLSPMETNEFTNQLVAFTGVEQQINTNQKLDSLVALQLGGALSSALGYVGLDISYVSSEFYSDGQTPTTVTYALNSPAVENTIRIENELGQTVYEEKGGTNVGKQEFVWDGKDKQGNPVPEGTYSVRIDALNSEDQGVRSTVIVSGRVTGVESQDGGIFLIVGDRAVGLSNVLNARQPASILAPPENTEGEDS